MEEEQEQEQRAQQRQESPRRPTTIGWDFYIGKQVMLQLAEPYVGCGYDHRPTEVAGGGFAAIPLLAGILNTADDGNGGTLILLSMPTGRNRDVVIIALKPQTIVFCSHIHEPSILTAP